MDYDVLVNRLFDQWDCRSDSELTNSELIAGDIIAPNPDYTPWITNNPQFLCVVLKLASLLTAHTLGRSAFLDDDQCFILLQICIKLKPHLEGKLLLSMEELITNLTQTIHGFTLSVQDIDTLAYSCGPQHLSATKIGAIEHFKGEWMEGYKNRHPEEQATFSPSEIMRSNVFKEVDPDIQQRLEYYKRHGLGGILSKGATMVLLVRLRQCETLESPSEYRTLKRKLEVDQGGADQYIFSDAEIKLMCDACAAKPPPFLLSGVKTSQPSTRYINIPSAVVHERTFLQACFEWDLQIGHWAEATAVALQSSDYPFPKSMSNLALKSYGVFRKWEFCSKKQMVDVIDVTPSLTMGTVDAQLDRYRCLIDQIIQPAEPTPDVLLPHHLKLDLFIRFIQKVLEQKDTVDATNKSLLVQLEAHQKTTNDKIAERLRDRDIEYKSTEDAMKRAILEKREALRKNVSQAVELSRAKEEAIRAKLFLAEKRKDLEEGYAEKSRKADAELSGAKKELASLSLQYNNIQHTLEVTTKNLELVDSKYNKFKEKQLEFKQKAGKIAEKNKAFRDEKKILVREKTKLQNERQSLEEQVEFLQKERDDYSMISKKGSDSEHTASTKDDAEAKTDSETSSKHGSQTSTKAFQNQTNDLQLEKDLMNSEMERLQKQVQQTRLDKDAAIEKQTQEKTRCAEKLAQKDKVIRDKDAEIQLRDSEIESRNSELKIKETELAAAKETIACFETAAREARARYKEFGMIDIFGMAE